ncbi:MAG TPA: hypothetical protein VMU25_03445 [Candidatus Paceibacterota bacterium]|nr:hypothetical protein [Candidatus Paceibacterota bacterium]
MADREIITRDDSSSAAIILLGIFVVLLVLFGIWYASRHTVVTAPGIPNTGVPSTQINVNPSQSGGGNSGATPPSPSPSGQ